ncbi:DUF481 domain-containing protein [Martelella mediterranea]|uniref:Uncharacterized protein DUF481 n=1 Tax=Martelella mediterranea TaxID=293089 RepID=A0A4R3NHQ7_9HYPH|nr:DUF481 domain-containing protein [Martelella mediterranea]TCT33030.1 uncharacterized protein DUF481 [Martelella mediterranea]
MDRFLKTTFCSAMLLISSTYIAKAADPITETPERKMVTVTAEETGNDWHFVLTPYIWATGLSGDVSPFRQAPRVHVDQSFSDILENLNIAGFVNLYAGNGQYGIYADMMYVSTSESGGTGPVTLPGLGSVRGVDIGVDSELFAGALFGSYRLVNTDQLTVDALAGVRAFNVWTKVKAAIPSQGLSTEAESNFGWIDPAVGADFKYHVNDRFDIVGQADIGGFSAGSDLTWQAMAAVKYQMTQTSALSFGYKYMSVNYDDDGHVFDTEFQGPMLGVSFRF